jgi:hypothetical protein
MITHSRRLDDATAEKAILDYLVVRLAGAERALHDELTAAIREAEAHRMNRPIGAELEAMHAARTVSRLLGGGEPQLLAAARRVLVACDRTTTALAVISDVAARQRPQAPRQRRVARAG